MQLPNRHIAQLPAHHVGNSHRAKPPTHHAVSRRAGDAQHLVVLEGAGGLAPIEHICRVRGPPIRAAWGQGRCDLDAVLPPTLGAVAQVGEGGDFHHVSTTLLSESLGGLLQRAAGLLGLGWTRV